MNYRFCLTLICFGLFLSSNFAQSYETIFGQDTTQWQVKYCQLGVNTPVSKIAIEDTLINGFTYLKVGERSNNSIDYSLSGNAGITNGFLREDTSSGKVWYIGTITPPFGQTDTVEFLVADLSLNLGDTFVVQHYLIDSTVLVDSVYYASGLKQVRLNYVLPGIAHTSNKLVFMEGIGTNFGFAYMHWNSADNLCPCLFSYQKDNVISPLNPPCIISSTKELQATSNQQRISVAPHPIQNISLFSFKNPNSKQTQLTIYDTSGKIIRHYETTGSLIEIQKEQLRGFYSYQLKMEGQHSAQGKLIFLE